jgi:hypothetical protein
MKSQSSIGFDNKDWGNENKKEARERSVFGMYRKVMGSLSLPVDKQYWTLAGMHSNDNCELPHAIRCGLLSSPGQFHGVDRLEAVIEHNRSLYPDAHWYCGEFAHALEEADPFNPGMVNFDMVNMVDGACHNAVQVLSTLVGRDAKDVFMVANFLLNNPRKNSMVCKPVTDFWEWFYRSPDHRFVLREALDQGWRVHSEMYLYSGADSKSRSHMQTVYFYRLKGVLTA